MADWLLFAKEKLVIKQQLFIVPDMITLFQEAVEAPPGPLNTSGVASKKGTACDASPDGSLYEYRPNLCRFGIECRDHACQLDTSGTCSSSLGACDTAGPPCPGNPLVDLCVPTKSYVSLLSAPLAPSVGGAVAVPVLGRQTLELCRPGPSTGHCSNNPATTCDEDSDCGSGNQCNFFPGLGAGAAFGAEPDFLYLVNEPARSLSSPVPPLNIPPFNGLIAAACLETVRSEGWCDCTAATGGDPDGGAEIKLDVDACIDHNANAGHCTVTGGSCTVPSGCPSLAGNTCTFGTCTITNNACSGPPDCPTSQTCSYVAGPNDACGAPVSTAEDDGDHKGTMNGKLTINTSGASKAGDCFDLITLQFKLVESTEDFGPDGVPCTDDDFVAPTTPLTLPMTTGTATAMVEDAVQSPATCSVGRCDGSTTVPCSNGAPCAAFTPNTCGGFPSCIEDANCASANGGFGGTCTNPSPTLVSLGLGPITGARGSCGAYRASNLSGAAFVGAGPALDAHDVLGDLVTAFKLTCK